MRGMSQTEIARPTSPPMNINGGGFDPMDGFRRAAFVVALLVVAALGGLLVVAVMPGDYATWASIGWARCLLALWGVLISLVCLAWGAAGAWLTVRAWIDNAAWVEEYRRLAADAYSAADGLEKERTVAAWQLDDGNVAHVLLAAFATHSRVLAGERSPFTVRNMEGNVMDRGRSFGTIGGRAAEDMPRRFAALGLIAGRDGRGRMAGEWTCETYEDVYMRVLDNWQQATRRALR